MEKSTGSLYKSAVGLVTGSRRWATRQLPWLPWRSDEIRPKTRNIANPNPVQLTNTTHRVQNIRCESVRFLFQSAITDAFRELVWQLKDRFRAPVPLLWKPRLGQMANLSARLTIAQRQRFRVLAELYDLASWPRAFDLNEVLENLYVLDVCDQYLAGPTKEHRVDIGCDIGSRNGAYLPALATFKAIDWHGVEVDAYRRYWFGTTREAYAEKLLEQFPNCHYIPASVTELSGPYRLITWFLPFLTLGSLRHGGLPLRYYEPERLLRHAWNMLASRGICFVVNQGPHEAQLQRELFDRCGINYEDLGEIRSVFSRYHSKRFGWLLRKQRSG